MAGLLAWAADVVGGGGDVPTDHDNAISNSIPAAFTPDQKKYVEGLDHRAASLSRSIQDLSLRLPPPDISQRLPHLNAHSIPSNAALAPQLNAHSATRQQALLLIGIKTLSLSNKKLAQQREMTLIDENEAYEKAIWSCENKLQEKAKEADLLLRNFEELKQTEKQLKSELEKAEDFITSRRSGKPDDSDVEPRMMLETGVDAEKSSIQVNIYEKKSCYI